MDIRPLTANVTSDDLEWIDSVEVWPLYHALQKTNLPYSVKTEVFNRIINQKVEAENHLHLTAGHIAEHLNTFFGRTMSVKNKAHGRLTAVLVKAHEREFFTFTIDGVSVKLHENDTVYVRPKYGTSFSNSRYPWVANPSLGRLTPERRPADHRVFVPGHRAGKTAAQESHQAFLAKMYPSNQLDYTGDSWWYYNNRSYVGKTVQLGSGDPAKSGVKGVCTQVTYEEGKLFFIIDGLLYKRNRHTTIRVWNKEN